MQSPDRTGRLVLLAVGGLGASAVMAQLALLRELLGAFSGNELALGIGLGSWLLLTGAGTWLGGRAPRLRDPAGVLVAGLAAVAVIPLAQVAAVRVLRDVVFLRGAAVGVTGTVGGTVALLLPFCVPAGFLLTLACGLLAPRAGATGLGRVYVADGVGSVVGGALFTFVLVPWFDHFALLCFPAFLNLGLAGALAWHFRRRVLLGSIGLVAAGLAVHLALVDADAVTTAVQHWGLVPVYRTNSPYGRLVVTEDAGQLTFFENGVPVISTQNVGQVEETVHYAMSQRPEARRVLLIGGGVTGTAREILRYGVERLTYVEIDPQIIAAGRRFLPDNLADPRIETVAADGRRFVQQTQERFEVVIIDLPDPSTLQLNRFFTSGFFCEIRRVLAPGGVLSFGLSHYENYVGAELARLLASAHRTLAGAFAQVRMVPGGRIFFLASDGPLTLDIAARLEQRGLTARLVNRHYLDAMLAPDRLADLDRAVAEPAAINTDFSPALYYYHLRYWLSQFTGRTGLLGGVLALLLAVYLVRLRAVPRVVFAAGFAASGLEIVLLLGYQVLYGSVYRQVGLVITVFMAGLAAGAWWANRPVGGKRVLAGARPPTVAEEDPPAGTHPHQPPAPSGPSITTRSPGGSTRTLNRLALAIAVLAALLPVVLPHLARLDAAAGSALAGQAVILGLTFALATLVGAQFPLAAAADPAEAAATASRLYTADLAGASLGALLVSTLLVPVLGVTAVCLLTAGLNAAAAAIAWRSTPRP